MRKALIIFFILIFALLQACMPVLCANPLSLSYSGGIGSGGSESKFDENNWTYTYSYHVLVLTGDIPQGSLFSQVQAGQNGDYTGLTYAKLKLSGSTYSIDLGDSITNFSELTLNNVAYQGTGVTIKPSSDFTLSVVGGRRGNGMWGADVNRDTRAKDNFTGVKTVFSPGSGLGLTAIYLTTPGGADVLSYGGEYDIENLKLAAEYGSAVDGKAFSGEIKYQDNFLSLGTVYRDVDTTYVVPFDYVTYKGMKGTYSTIGIRPSNNMSINVQNNSYIDRLNTSGEAANLDTRGDISYNNINSGTTIGYSGWKNDRRAYERGDLTEGEIMYITQQFFLLTRNSIYYRSQPTWFTSLYSSEESYSEKKDITGINISLFDAIHLNYEIENAIKIFKDTDIQVEPSAISARLDLFERQISDSPFYVSGSVNYRKDIPDKDVSEEADSVSCYSDVTLKYMPSPDLTCFVTTKVFDMTSPDADRTAREQRDLSYGLSCTFNTNFCLK